MIEIDAVTTLTGIPPAAWDYKLGNHCGLGLVFDHQKEEKCKDRAVAEQSNAYRFGDYKEKAIVSARPRLHGERENDAPLRAISADLPIAPHHARRCPAER